jgi:hypothetical protein
MFGHPSSKKATLLLTFLAILCLRVLSDKSWAAALPIDPGSWTLAVLPDTQDYTEFNFPHFTNQTQWIADHTTSHNIKYVLHEGDVTEHNNPVQWNRGLNSMNLLNDVVPYAIAPGNHDYGPNGFSGDRSSMFNQPEYFGLGSYYANQPSVGGFFEDGKTDNSYHTFSAGGKDWLVLALEWGPRDDVVAWANQVVTDHSDHLAMLVTHAYMYYDETRYDWATKGPQQQWNPNSYPIANLPGGSVNDGEQLWDKLVSKHENFRFVFNGHVIGDGTGFLSSVGDHGNVVHQMLANYQFKAQGGSGDMRLLEFLPDGETVVVRTYSPSLDRYDTKYDQQFTLNLNELHEPLGPPIIPHVVAANINVAGLTVTNDNSVGSVTVPQSGQPTVGTLQLNRSDFQVSAGGNGLEYQRGILLATISQNTRDGIRASVEVGRNSFNDGLMALSVMQAGQAGGVEVNFNAAVAWFDFRAGWQGGHVNANGNFAAEASNNVEQSMLTKSATGRYKLDLGVNSITDGMLFAIGNNNSNIVVQAGIYADGSGWDLRVHHNAASHSGTGLDRDFSFLYLPFNTAGLIGGVYDGAAEGSLASAGNFLLTRLGTGEYELNIPGESPETGMLILTVAGRGIDSGTLAPDDNLLSYQPSAAGSFLINSIDLPSFSLEDTTFAWAFMSFTNPLVPASSDIPEPKTIVLLSLFLNSAWQRRYTRKSSLGASIVT